MISAKVICDSIGLQGHRVTTFELRYPKFIHGEFMTHRVISRNASSSRAIPTAKLLEEVRSETLRAGPVWWGKNQSGMQAAEELNDEHSIGSELAELIGQNNTFHDLVKLDKSIVENVPSSNVTRKTMAKLLWSDAAYMASDTAEAMLKLGVHKQIVNRLLEPFSHINVVATATEWMNFFGLRLDKAAQPEMRALAVAMWGAYLSSVPILLLPGEWHLPYIPIDDGCGHEIKWKEGLDDIDTVRKVSVARCARVSYRSFETGKESTNEEDIALYARLLSAQPLHASPAEHQCTPDSMTKRYLGHGDYDEPWDTPKQHGNFVGWRQYRKMLSGENCAPLPEEYQTLKG